MSRRRRAEEEENGVVGEAFDLPGEDLSPVQHVEAWYDTAKWTQAQLDEQVLGPAIARLAAGPA